MTNPRVTAMVHAFRRTAAELLERLHAGTYSDADLTLAEDISKAWSTRVHQRPPDVREESKNLVAITRRRYEELMMVEYRASAVLTDEKQGPVARKTARHIIGPKP
jgi:hypothetical protein